MKKVMIGILVLIPIIIMVVVSLVSVFVSTRTHIAVDKVELSRSSVDIALSDNTYDLNNYIEVTVLPEKATNKSYKWSFENIVCLDENYRADWEKGDALAPASLLDDKSNYVDENSTGLFKVNSYCSFYAVAQAETMTARCLIYVVGYEVKAITLTSQDNSEFNVGDKRLLSPNYTPVDSIVGDTHWESDNEAVATVDGNGVVKANGIGTANITVRAKIYKRDEYVKSAPYTVNVSSGVTKFGTSVAVHENEVPLSDFGVTSAEAVEGCTIENGKLVFETGIILAKIKVGAQTVTVKRVDPNAIAIENADVFAYSQNDDHFVLETADFTSGEKVLPLRLSAKWTSDQKEGKPTVQWSSDRPAVASVDENGNVVGRADGIVVITATRGSYTASITLDVRKKVTTLSLDKTNESLAVGIARETVFADLIYLEPDNLENHAVLDNTVEINFLRPFVENSASEEEKNAFYEAFQYSVSSNDGIVYASFIDNKPIVKFNSANIENYYKSHDDMLVLTVTVKAKYPKYKSNASYTTCVFNLKVVHGVCASSYTSLYKATNDFENVCMISNAERTKSNDPNITVRRALYGNNHIVSGTHETVPSRNTNLFNVKNDNVKFSNISVRCIGDIEEEISDAQDNVGLQGYCIYIEAPSDPVTGIRPHLNNIKLEYSIFENCTIAVRVYDASVTFDGCIVRNTSEVAVYVVASIADVSGSDGVRHADNFYGKIAVRNMIMSNMLGTAFSFYYKDFSNGSNQFNSKEQAELAVAEGKNTTLYQEGFIDIYNWQELNVVNLLPEGVLDDKLQSALNAGIRGALNSKAFSEKYAVKSNGVDYFHLGFMSTGITEKTYLETHFEDKRLQCVSSDDVLPIKLGDYAALIFSYGQTYGNLHPSKTYNLDAKLINKLHGEY